MLTCISRTIRCSQKPKIFSSEYKYTSTNIAIIIYFYRHTHTLIIHILIRVFFYAEKRSLIFQKQMEEKLEDNKLLTSKEDSLSAATINDLSWVSFFIFLKRRNNGNGNCTKQQANYFQITFDKYAFFL